MVVLGGLKMISYLLTLILICLRFRFDLDYPENHKFRKIYKYVIQYNILPAFISEMFYSALVYFYFDRFISDSNGDYSPMPPIASFLNYALMILSAAPSLLVFLLKRFKSCCNICETVRRHFLLSRCMFIADFAQ